MNPFAHYHGGPITPNAVARQVWGCAFVSFAYPQQTALAQECATSYALDNGAFSAWTQGRVIDFAAFASWVRKCHTERPVDFAIVPDVIDGDDADNDALLCGWPDDLPGAPVWHLHETVDRLARLCAETVAGRWERVCFGSSGEYATPGNAAWWTRMGDAMDAICDVDGNPPCRLHGLRMLDPAILVRLGGFASADSTNVARNHNRQSKRREGPSDFARYIERHVPPERWQRQRQGSLFAANAAAPR